VLVALVQGYVVADDLATAKAHLTQRSLPQRAAGSRSN